MDVEYTYVASVVHTPYNMPIERSYVLEDTNSQSLVVSFVCRGRSSTAKSECQASMPTLLNHIMASRHKNHVCGTWYDDNSSC